MKLFIGDRKRGWRTVLLLAAGAWCSVAAKGAFGATGAATCSGNSEVRQLDYWLGEWTVTNPSGSNRSISKVSLSLDKCLFVESWDNGKGHTGKDMFAYSPDDKSWHGMFADNQGRVHIFVDGKVAAGSAEFYGPSRGPSGEEILNRIRLIRVTANKLQQTWEKSIDKGVTWTKVFGGEYLRQNH